MSKQLHEDDEIKQLFVDESIEALQRVEKLLLEAEQGKARGNMVDTMFRDMHTIKGRPIPNDTVRWDNNDAVGPKGAPTSTR